jgi:hypothetical protein
MFPDQPLPSSFLPSHVHPQEAYVDSRHGAVRAYRTAGWLLAAMVAIPAITAADQPSQASFPPWSLKLAIHYLPPPTNRSQYGVVLAWGDQAWFLGGTNVTGPGKPKAERIRNGLPQSTVLPPGAHSWIVAASAPAPTNIWAVTYLGGSVLNWNGSAWTTEPRGAWKTGTRFTGITALSKTNVWVFGTSGRLHPGAGTWHFNGKAWRRAKGAASGIFQASAASRFDIWAIGNAGRSLNALFQFSGSAWRRTRPQALAGFTYSHVLALSRSDVWVAGKVAGVPKLGHFDGHGWRELRVPGKTAATGMCRDGRRGMWVVANSGTAPSVVLDRSANGTWTRVKVSQNVANKVLACALVPGTLRAWGAGTAVAPSGSAAAAYRTG